jgi:Glycosyl transferases group 1
LKILIANDGPTAHYYMRLGIARALGAMGHEVIMWDINSKSAFDAFDEFEPHVFFGQSYNIDGGLMKCLLSRPYLKVVMKAGDFGEIGDSLDKNMFPVLMASPKEIENVTTLKDKIDKPDFLEIHYHEDYIDGTHGHWKELDINVESIMSAVDTFDYINGKYNPAFASDVAFVGGYWPYKAVVLDQYLVPLCDLRTNLNVKIFGNQAWPVANFCGFVDNTYVADVFASATICPNLHEPHSQVLGYDVVERPFKLLGGGNFVISDYVEGLYKLFPNEIVYAHTPQEFHELIFHFVKNPDERLPYMEQGKKTVMADHTYFDRVAKIFSKLNMPDQVELALVTKGKVVGKPI